MEQVAYHSEFYNEFNDTEQWIRLSDGCFRNCWNCYCPTQKLSYEVPEIVRNKVVILDMNFLYACPEPLNIIQKLGSQRVNGKKVYYDFYCGLDFTLLTPTVCEALKLYRFGRFTNKRKYISGIRMAWDRSIREQKEIKKAVQMLKEAGYNPKSLQVFMLCNGKEVSFGECKLKLDLMKIWNVQVADCWYDNQKRGSVEPIGWTKSECDDFGRLCRDHNLMVMYGIHPEI